MQVYKFKVMSSNGISSVAHVIILVCMVLRYIDASAFTNEPGVLCVCACARECVYEWRVMDLIYSF